MFKDAINTPDERAKMCLFYNVSKLFKFKNKGTRRTSKDIGPVSPLLPRGSFAQYVCKISEILTFFTS